MTIIHDLGKEIKIRLNLHLNIFNFVVFCVKYAKLLEINVVIVYNNKKETNYNELFGKI